MSVGQVELFQYRLPTFPDAFGFDMLRNAEKLCVPVRRLFAVPVARRSVWVVVAVALGRTARAVHTLDLLASYRSLGKAQSRVCFAECC